MPIRRRLTTLTLACAASLLLSPARAASSPAIDWQPWSAALLQQAAAQHKLVLLDLEAVWCHWCHVMDDSTYSDPQVIALIRDKYIAVRVDQDSRPDLANRYEDYGWPATVIFKWDGSELAKRRGYIPPKPMASMLQAFAGDPTPGPSIEQQPSPAPAAEAALSPGQISAMRALFLRACDPRLGGWGHTQKFLDWDALEYSLTQGAAGDPSMDAMARQTLTAGLKLIDPVWGGVDQYSINGDWDHPHFEKIMPFQAETIRILAQAASEWHEPQWLLPARQIHRYLQTFLTSPDGAFYTSQDADATPGEQAAAYFALDDAARRKQGLPRVDKHIYARDNGLAITGLAALSAAGGDPSSLADARRAATWILAHRAIPGGGFRHDSTDTAGPYLADTLEMGRAFLALYSVTAERSWLARAEAAARFIDAKFRAPLGFATAAAAPSSPLPPQPELEENVTLARFANLLAHDTGQSAYREMAVHAMRYNASKVVIARQGYSVAGILLANRELGTNPIHVTIVGAKDDPAARALFATALRDAPPYTRLEWYARREGPLPNTDVEYPALPMAAAYLCTNSACSSPSRTPDALAHKLAGQLRSSSAAPLTSAADRTQ
jgi:uncharacterized protein YyaL (SSP411 family)